MPRFRFGFSDLPWNIRRRTPHSGYPAPNVAGELTYRVLRVIDGDTIESEHGGQLIGVDGTLMAFQAIFLLGFLVCGVGGTVLWIWMLVDCLKHESSQGNTNRDFPADEIETLIRPDNEPLALMNQPCQTIGECTSLAGSGPC